MKNIVLVLAACSFVACKTTTEDKGTPKGEACTHSGDEKCSADGTQVLQCNGTRYVTEKTCDGGKVCTAATGVAIATCQTPDSPGEIGDPCGLAGDDECADGSFCFLDLANIADIDPEHPQTCMAACDPANDTCGANMYCGELFDTDGNDSVDAGVCEPKMGSLGVCFGDAGCTEAGETCEFVNIDSSTGQDLPVSVCSAECPSDHVNVDAGGCPASLTCLPSLFVETESDTACTDDTTCTTANGFTCMSLTTGKKCARPQGVCGTPLKMFSQESEIATTAGLTAEAQANVCDPFADGVLGFCGTTGTTFPHAAEMACIGFGTDGGAPSFCFGFCAGPEGGDDLECGTGYHCGEPAEPLFFAVQDDENGDAVTCTTIGADAACDAGGGFTCNELSAGKTCSKASKVCIAD